MTIESIKQIYGNDQTLFGLSVLPREAEIRIEVAAQFPGEIRVEIDPMTELPGGVAGQERVVIYVWAKSETVLKEFAKQTADRIAGEKKQPEKKSSKI